MNQTKYESLAVSSSSNIVENITNPTNHQAAQRKTGRIEEYNCEMFKKGWKRPISYNITISDDAMI